MYFGPVVSFLLSVSGGKGIINETRRSFFVQNCIYSPELEMNLGFNNCKLAKKDCLALASRRFSPSELIIDSTHSR